MKDFNTKLFLFISCILVVCVFLRITGNTELSNVKEPAIEDTLTEIEVERKNPDVSKTKTKKITKKTTKKKKVIKKANNTKEDKNIVIFEDITKDDYKNDEAIVKIEQQEIKISEPLTNTGDYWKTYDPLNDPEIDINNIKLPTNLTDEKDNQI